MIKEFASATEIDFDANSLITANGAAAGRNEERQRRVIMKLTASVEINTAVNLMIAGPGRAGPGRAGPGEGRGVT
ncbi:hypothetical protein O7602_14655 [Micromonospora sp. WMMD1128]|uniref:hypothetical protein n=1 Tax=Micromonospora sp. WMMD1128 TaxID=3015150 RepID=UPI00248CCEF9|nr:hypothetical protein [Micromonospora sp. WMMD1128]WBB76695.1 hypothetical protein O7602_14655 [Micromonospora sp. WMMD1128]